MDDSTSGMRDGREAQEANLRPFKPGDVGNPKGTNQYTYRRDFERTIDAMLKGELSPKEAEAVPDWVLDVITPGMTRGEAIAAVTVAGALRGDSRHLLGVLKRIWPETQKHEISEVHRSPLTVPQPDLSHLTEEEIATARKLAAKALMGRPKPIDPDTTSLDPPE